MTVARTAADVLSGHVTMEIESVDRMYLNLYVPPLQRELGVVGFFKHHRGQPFASGALMQPITEAFVAGVYRFADEGGVDIYNFKAGQRKDDVALQYLASFDREEGIMFVGVAQEKTWIWGTRKKRNPDTGAVFPWIAKDTRVPNHFYFYGVDRDFGPFVIKFCSYFPYNGRVILNGHEYAKRQATRKGIEFTGLDNGFAAGDHRRLQRVCDGFTSSRIEGFVHKWLRILPNPFTAADRAAGFGYQLSILQVELSLTQVLDSARAGRAFFDDVIRHNLDLGRPDRVGLIFDRRVITKGRFKTPGRFRTRVITEGVTPSLHIDYKHSKIKQYHKLGVALRTETTINNSYDFDIGRGLHNLDALRQVGFAANRRLLDVQRTSHDPFIGTARLAELAAPVIIDGDRKTSGLRFGDPAVHALAPGLPAALPPPPGRLHQRQPTCPARRRPRHRPAHPRADELPATATAPARIHQTTTRTPPLPAHRHRPTNRRRLHPGPRPRPSHRHRAHQRPQPAQRPTPRLHPPRRTILPGRVAATHCPHWTSPDQRVRT